MNITTGATSQALHTILIDQRGETLVWGNNDHGILGLGTDYSIIEPTGGFEVVDEPGNRLTVVFYAVGYMHTTCLTKNGDVYAWGNNGFGELGVGDNEHKSRPTKVNFPRDDR
jgi:alpha-tubulin suppressor-like RCC1 family protein